MAGAPKNNLHEEREKAKKTPTSFFLISKNVLHILTFFGGEK